MYRRVYVDNSSIRHCFHFMLMIIDLNVMYIFEKLFEAIQMRTVIYDTVCILLC